MLVLSSLAWLLAMPSIIKIERMSPLSVVVCQSRLTNIVVPFPRQGGCSINVDPNPRSYASEIPIRSGRTGLVSFDSRMSPAASSFSYYLLYGLS